MKKKSIILVAFTLVVSFQVSAQTLRYKILWRGDSVGYLEATKKDSLAYQVYTINSEVGFWLFGKRIIQSKYTSIYDQDQLMQSNAAHYRDGKLKEKTEVVRINDQYEVISDGEEQESILSSISQSIARIYFHKPLSEPLFSERHGQFLSVESKDGLEYKIEKPDGRMNTYVFGNEYCNLVEVDNVWAKLYFVRIKQTM